MNKSTLLLAACFLWLGAIASAQVPEDAPRPKPDFAGRKAPAMSMEQAIDTARKALTKQATPLRNRFVSRAEYIFEPKDFPHEAAEGKDPFWLVVLRDPEYASEVYPVAPIRVLVFSAQRVAILAPQ